MSKFRITAPDGRQFDITAPEGASQDEVLAYAQAQWKPQPVAEPAPDPSAGGGSLQILNPFGKNLDTGIPTSQGVERFLAGAGKAFTDLGRGTGQIVGAVDQQGIAESKALDKPLMNTGAGFAGNVTGNVAALLPTAFIPGANTIPGAAAVGAASGLLAPQAEGNVAVGKLVDAGVGSILGAGGVAAGRALNAGWNAGKGVIEPFTKGGQQNIVGRTLQRFATNPDAAATAANGFADAVPGYASTLAEATQDPGLATLQRAVMNTDAAAQIGARDVANAGAVKSAVGAMAGDDVARAAAVAARKQASQPLYNAVAKAAEPVNTKRTVGLIDAVVEANPANKALVTPLQQIRESLFEHYPADRRGADTWRYLNETINAKSLPQREWNVLAQARTVMDRVRKGAIEPDEALQQLKGLGSKRGEIAGALDYARAQMKSPDYVLMEGPQQVKSAIDNVSTLLSDPANSTLKRQLTIIKKSLSNQLGKAVPEYRQATRTFADMSAPINRMDVGSALYNKLAPALDDFAATPRLKAESFAGALRNGDETVRSATGMRRSLDQVMLPDEMQTLNNVGATLARRASAADLARPAGTNTAQNLSSQNLMRQIAGPLGLPQNFAEARVWPSLLRPVDFVMKGQEPAINDVLGQAMLDPRFAAQLLQRAQRPQTAGLLTNAATRAVVNPGLLGAYASQQ